ncbi:MAG: class I SAM-dependent methyltransferase [Bacteroidota bacterium]
MDVNRQPVPPYEQLAHGYDLVMAHVDYADWAAFVHGLLWTHHPAPRRILELGCGTGTFALELQPLGAYTYLASDASPAMLEVARAKAAAASLPVQFSHADFTTFTVDEPVDVVMLLYDGLNYLLEPDQVARLFEQTYQALKPGGVFFFDQSTPANSINNAAYFEDQGETEAFSYRRFSDYDAAAQLHTTSFEIEVGGQTYAEQHVQRAYTLEAIGRLIDQTAFERVRTYDGFSDDQADERSERIHWVLRRPLGPAAETEGRP